MTDFGRRVALHKETHQDAGTDEISVEGLSGQLGDEQTVAAHDLGGDKHNAATLAQLNAKVSDATLDDSGDARTPTAHKASHQSGGSDEMDITGLTGATAEALMLGAFTGYEFRQIDFYIQDGTGAATIKVKAAQALNGDVISEVDNIGKGDTSGVFTLSSDGKLLTIDASAFTGTLRAFWLSIIRNQTNAYLWPMLEGSDPLYVYWTYINTGDTVDITGLVDNGTLRFRFCYITDA